MPDKADPLWTAVKSFQDALSAHQDENVCLWINNHFSVSSIIVKTIKIKPNQPNKSLSAAVSYLESFHPRDLQENKIKPEFSASLGLVFLVSPNVWGFSCMPGFVLSSSLPVFHGLNKHGHGWSFLPF